MTATTERPAARFEASDTQILLATPDDGPDCFTLSLGRYEYSGSVTQATDQTWILRTDYVEAHQFPSLSAAIRWFVSVSNAQEAARS